MWIGNYVRGSIHEQFKVVCGLVEMMEDGDMT
jgi:hypothetical protein